MISFGTPGWLWLLLMVPAWLLLRRVPGFEPPALGFSGAAYLESTAGKGRARFLPWLLALQSVSLVLLILALARPQRVEAQEAGAGPARDLYLLLDLSSSMADPIWAKGEKPIEAAKTVVREFVESRRGDRIGLITFARYPELACPLTRDHAFLLDLVERAE